MLNLTMIELKIVGKLVNSRDDFSREEIRQMTRLFTTQHDLDKQEFFDIGLNQT